MPTDSERYHDIYHDTTRPLSTGPHTQRDRTRKRRRDVEEGAGGRQNMKNCLSCKRNFSYSVDRSRLLDPLTKRSSGRCRGILLYSYGHVPTFQPLVSNQRSSKVVMSHDSFVCFPWTKGGLCDIPWR